MAVDVCFAVSHGFAARMLFHSELVPALRARGLSVSALLPAIETTNGDAIQVEGGLDVRQVAMRKGVGSDLAMRVKPYLYENVRRNPALWSKHVRSVRGIDGSAKWRVLAPGFLLVNEVVSRVPLFQKACVALERRALRSASARNVLQDLAPGIVVSTYPVNSFEAALIIEAQHLGIPTVGQLLSWDNITTKGHFVAVPDRFVSWGPIMTEELREYYAIPRDCVIEAGVPHFDAHIKRVDAAKQADVIRELGLRPDRPYLFFGMSSPVFAPEEVAIVEWLAEAVVSNRFGQNMQLVIRPHPQNIEGGMADRSWLPRLDALRSERVGVDYPILKKSSLPWNLDREDLSKLVNLIGGCDVCLNSGSTLSIDAIVQDKPVVVTLFDAGTTRPWWDSARRVARYPHLGKLFALGGVRVVGSFGELESAILRYLDDPSVDCEGRARVRRLELGDCDGRASERVAEAIASMLRTGT